MRAVHDPLSPPERCPGCVVDPDGYDHAAVLAARTVDFDAQVVACLREIERTGQLCVQGKLAFPASAKGALRALIERGVEPRKPRRAA